MPEKLFFVLVGWDTIGFSLPEGDNVHVLYNTYIIYNLLIHSCNYLSRNKFFVNYV